MQCRMTATISWPFIVCGSNSMHSISAQIASAALSRMLSSFTQPPDLLAIILRQIGMQADLQFLCPGRYRFQLNGRPKKLIAECFDVVQQDLARRKGTAANTPSSVVVLVEAWS